MTRAAKVARQRVQGHICRPSVLHVPFLQLAPSPVEADALRRACSRVIESGRYIGGPEVEGFERDAAAYLGSPRAIACSSGSDALVIALQAVGVAPGDEVVVPAFSFFATAESILRVGAVPRFVDIELETLGAEPAAVEAALGPKARAVLVVHIAGVPARIDSIRALAQAQGVPCIEDSAQAFGSRWHGRALGSFGTVGCFSFQATKPLGALGDAGMVVTADRALAERCRQLTVHGATGRHQHAAIGGNYRMDAIHAAMLREKLAAYDAALAARERIARVYTAELGSAAARAGVTLPALPAAARSNHALYTVRVHGAGRRDALARHLGERGVETSVYYPTPLYRQPALLQCGYGLPVGARPRTEQACSEVLSLPLYPTLTHAQHEHVIASVRDFVLGG